MDDNRLENRKIQFQKTSMSILECREDKRISLRKEKLEEFLFNKRQKNRICLDLEVNPFKLDVPKEFLDRSCQTEVYYL